MVRRAESPILLPMCPPTMTTVLPRLLRPPRLVEVDAALRVAEPLLDVVEAEGVALRLPCKPLKVRSRLRSKRRLR